MWWSQHVAAKPTASRDRDFAARAKRMLHMISQPILHTCPSKQASSNLPHMSPCIPQERDFAAQLLHVGRREEGRTLLAEHAAWLDGQGAKAAPATGATSRICVW